MEGRNGSRKAMNAFAVSVWWMSTGINVRSFSNLLPPNLFAAQN